MTLAEQIPDPNGFREWFIVSLPLLAAVVAFAALWCATSRNIKAGKTGLEKQIKEAEEARKRDAIAAAERELTKHQRDAITLHLATLLGHTEALKAVLRKARNRALPLAKVHEQVDEHLSAVTSAAQPVKLVDSRLVSEVDGLVSACGSANSCVHQELTAELANEQVSQDKIVTAKKNVDAASDALVGAYRALYYAPIDREDHTVNKPESVPPR